jgi:hypothetical protein
VVINPSSQYLYKILNSSYESAGNKNIIQNIVKSENCFSSGMVCSVVRSLLKFRRSILLQSSDWKNTQKKQVARSSVSFSDRYQFVLKEFISA